MATKIVTKNSSTGGSAPSASDLVQGELAVNVTDKRLYTENASGAIVELGTKPSTIDINAGTIDGTTVGASSASTGAFTTLSASGDVNFDSGTLFVDASANKVGIGTSSPSYALDVVSSATNNETLARFSSAGGVRAVFNTDSDDDGSLSLYDKSDAAKVLLRSLGNSYLNGGNVGIGTTNPDDGDLQIGDANSAFTIAVAGARTKFGYNGANAIVQGGSSKGVAFCVNNGTLGSGEAMRITSAGLVGIGTSSPAASAKLHISSGVNNTPTTFRIENTDQSIETNQEVNAIEFYTNDASGSGTGVSAKIAQTATNPGNQYGLAFSTYNTSLVEAMRIETNGNVGIGTASPSARVTVSGTGVGAAIDWKNTTASTGRSYRWVSLNNGSGFALEDLTASAERMRLDASGNLLVGKTSSSISTEGNVLFGSGGSWFTNSASSTADFNRLSTDGDVVRFKKNGTTVGSIGVKSGGTLFIAGNSSQNTGIRCYTVGIAPCNSSGDYVDNSRDLGSSSARWDDIYATNGTIQTSDRNEKQDIAELSDAEQRVAVACKGLLRKFRWKDSVAEKGDDARTHFGIIAQDLQAAFVAEGLDAGDYAMFISTTWTDEETNEEKTRMGVRYSELLAFIISAI